MWGGIAAGGAAFGRLLRGILTDLLLPISLCIVVGAGLSQQLVRRLGVRIWRSAG